MYRVLVTIFLLSLSNIVKAQSIDSASIAFKAKLFTTSIYGVADKLLILEDIQNQELTFIKSSIPDIVLMKIKFGQKYYKEGGHQMDLIGSCNYYMAFNAKNQKFYRLGGFSSLDIDEFFTESDVITYLDINAHKGEIDFLCLLEYSEMSSLKKAKKGFDCFKACDQEISEYLIIPQKNSNK